MTIKLIYTFSTTRLVIAPLSYYSLYRGRTFLELQSNHHPYPSYIPRLLRIRYLLVISLKIYDLDRKFR